MWIYKIKCRGKKGKREGKKGEILEIDDECPLT